MAKRCRNISELAALLRENGDKVLDASSKLSVSTSLLHNINAALTDVINERGCFHSAFQVINSNIVKCFDLQLLYDFIQKTLALKISPGNQLTDNALTDIKMFKSLKLLEIQRISLNFIKGIRSLRPQLVYLTCMRSLNSLSEILENCGADKSQGFMWKELKQAIFSHNNLGSLDNSLEFAPRLQILDLSHNYIQDAQLLNCLPNLKYLNLSYNQIECVPAFTGQLCTCLQVLILRNNFIENISELAGLPNLRELDLRNNTLLDHSALAPLANMAALQWLSLLENPLSFHPQHRIYTAQFLHHDVASRQIVLDNRILNETEKEVIGSFTPLPLSTLRRSHLDSLCSTVSECTVIPVDKQLSSKQSYKLDIACCSDLDTSTSSVATFESHDQLNERSEITLLQEAMGMQDSGIVEGVRPTSPSDCSIGSATSFTSDTDIRPLKMTSNHYESDIEVISNPSQSSIEVLGSIPGQIRYVQSSNVIEIESVEELSTKRDLNKVDHHRSL